MLRKVVGVVAAALLASGGGFGADGFKAMKGQGRSMVVTRYGIVAAPQFLAAKAGTAILEAGGNAADAAIAANAVMGVTQPYVNGIGGDLFAIYYEAKSGQLYGLNASGWTPASLTIDYLKQHGVTKLDPISVHTITVPGCVAGWEALRSRFGTKKLEELLAPAVRYASEGFPLAERNARYWRSAKLLNQPGYRETYLPFGDHPEAGIMFRNAALANSLRIVGENGPDAFYRGELTPKIVDFLKEHGGAHTLGDFAEYKPEWVTPVSTSYRGWTVSELPPNGQGVAALSMLNIMEHFPLADYGQNSGAALHVMIEAKKLAYADMEHYVGDPRFTQVPTEKLISKELAKERAGLIRMDRAQCHVLPSELSEKLTSRGTETIYLSAVDAEGNIVSLIQSNYGGYGTGMVAPGLGFSFHNRGAGFELMPGRPNSIAGHKRPLHTIIPAFMSKGDLHISFGIMGGWNQAQAHAQFVSNVVDFGYNLQAALELPRFTKQSFEGCDLEIEETVSTASREDLTRRGHQLTLVEPFNFGAMGQGEAVMHDSARKVNFAGSDPRSDGEAIPQSPPLSISQAAQ